MKIQELKKTPIINILRRLNIETVEKKSFGLKPRGEMNKLLL